MSAIDNFVSEIRLLAGRLIPQYWYECKGQTLPVADNQSLFEQIGYRYGGSGANFALPNLTDPAPNLRYIICSQGIRPDPSLGLGTALIGEVRYIAALPAGCRDAFPADGRVLEIGFLQATFAILGTRFGGNGSTTFGLPSLPGLSPSNGPAIAPLLCVFGIFPREDSFYSDAYVSEIRQMALQFTARGWLPCQGQSVGLNAAPALLALISDRFGPPVGERFNLPNLPTVGGVPFVINAQGLWPDPN